MMRGIAATAMAFAGLLASSPASAEPRRDPAMAEALFNSARALLERGDWPAACAKLKASMDLDPSVSTALKIARCHEHEGKLALAWSDAREALKLNQTVSQAESRRRELAAYAERLIADLAPRVPKIRVRITNPPPELRLAYDDRPLPVDALGEALPIDPGEHTISADADGYLGLRRTVTLVEAQVLDVDLTLVPIAPPAAQPPAPVVGQASGGAPKPAAVLLDAPRRAPGVVQRGAGIGVFAVGIAALTSAGVLGLLTRGKVDAAAPYCAADFSSCHDAQGITLLNEARGLQTTAFVLLGVGAAAAGVGVGLFVTARRGAASARSAPAIIAAVGPLGVTLRGAW